MEALILKLGVFIILLLIGKSSSLESETTTSPTVTLSSAATVAVSAPTEAPSLTTPIALSPETPDTSDISCSGDPTVSPCSLSEGLVCHDGFCKCAYPHLKYDPSTKKCMARLGEQCGFFIGLKNASSVSCPQNAVCALVNLEMATDGINQYSSHQCACIYTHYQTSQGECLPLAQFGEQCDEKRKCNTESELLCIDGTCQCQFGSDQYFDVEKSTCISFAGGNCTRSCVSNSLCDFWGTGTCQCRLDFRPNALRQCEPIPPGYLSTCLGDRELCNAESGLKCIDKVCQCANPLHQMYDYKLDRCIGLAGDICDPEKPINCGGNASCSPVKKDSLPSTSGGELHSCQCVQGYSTTPYRKCMKGYGQECANEFCNVYRGLACINGKCQCYDSFLKYDETSEACRSSLGSPCGKIYVPFPGDWVKTTCPECDSYYFACDNESVCTRDFIESNEIGALEKFRCQPKNVL